MEFEILGPVVVRRAGHVVRIRSVRQRTLLAALLVRAGRVVPTDVLVDSLWGDRPPHTARNALQVHVSALRRVLADGPDRQLVRTWPLGYQLAVEPARVDAGRFEALLARARTARADGHLDSAAGDLRRALALWRGAALADVPSPALAAAAAELEDRRLQALEDRIDLELRLGRHAELTAELRGLVAEHPLRERLWEHLVVSLHRCGRRADALLAYREADALLRREVGVGPGVPLRRLHRRLLAPDPDVDQPRPVRRPAAGRAEALALRRRGDVLITAGRWDEARDCLDLSVATLSRIGDRQEEAHSRLCLAMLLWLRGQWDRATDILLDCLDVLRAGPDDDAAAEALRTLAMMRLRWGEPAAAADLFRQSLDRLGRPDGGEAALTRIQLVLTGSRSADPAETVGRVRDDLAVLRRTGRAQLEAHVLPDVATVALDAGDLSTAGSYLRRGLRLARAAGDPLAEGVTLYGLGELYARTGRPEPAGHCLSDSLDRFDRLGAAHWRCRVLLARAALPVSAGGPRRSVGTGHPLFPPRPGC